MKQSRSISPFAQAIGFKNVPFSVRFDENDPYDDDGTTDFMIDYDSEDLKKFKIPLAFFFVLCIIPLCVQKERFLDMTFHLENNLTRRVPIVRTLHRESLGRVGVGLLRQ